MKLSYNYITPTYLGSVLHDGGHELIHQAVQLRVPRHVVVVLLHQLILYPYVSYGEIVRSMAFLFRNLASKYVCATYLLAV